MRKIARRVRDLARIDPARLGDRIDYLHGSLASRIDNMSETLGRSEIERLARGPRLTSLHAYGVKVFSQWDEDGIIAHILREIPEAPKSFVEFGVDDYRESNTRFLIRQGNWRGLIIEANPGNCEAIRLLEESWRYDLRLVEAFITCETINDLISSAGFSGEIGLLSIDIDGNDYWVWEALSIVDPMVVVVEYNGRYGPDRAVTIPYDPTFRRMTASHTGIYYGASLAALVKLGSAKGYDYIGSNNADLNAFFVRSDVRPDTLSVLTAGEGFRRLRVREMRDSAGKLLFASHAEEDVSLAGLPLIEV